MEITMVKINKVDLHVKILPEQGEKLDRLRVNEGLTKGAMVGKLIDKTKEPKDE